MYNIADWARQHTTITLAQWCFTVAYIIAFERGFLCVWYGCIGLAKTKQGKRIGQFCQELENGHFAGTTLIIEAYKKLKKLLIKLLIKLIKFNSVVSFHCSI